MWHRALPAKTTAPDGTQKVQLKPLARATADLEIMTKELQNLQQSLAPWQLTNSTPSNSMESAMPNAPRDRALARSKLLQPSKPPLERCTKAGLVMPPASETDNGGYMQDNAQEMPLSLDALTHANLRIAHHALNPQRRMRAVTPAHTEEWHKQLDGFKTCTQMMTMLRDMPKKKHAAGIGTEHVMHGGSTVQNAMHDLCHMGFAGIDADITKDALLSPTLKSDRLATATRPLGALRQVQKMCDCWANVSQAELARRN